MAAQRPTSAKPRPKQGAAATTSAAPPPLAEPARTLDPFAAWAGARPAERWALGGLDPLPEEEWQRMREFLDLSDDEIAAMLATVEPLFKRGHELVVGTYDALLAHHETAAILGWEGGADAAHLSERRRFFTVWLARLLGMDFSSDLAGYLFRAGKLHAAHGARRTHVPPVYVTGSISLVNATFARFLREEMSGDPRVPLALAGWNKVLTMHLHLMQLGYTAAVDLDSGALPIAFSLFGKLRTLLGARELTVHVATDATVESALRKFFNYHPSARAEIFDVEWQGGERLDARGTPWFTVSRVYRVKTMWRALLNGRDIAYYGGIQSRLQPGDEIHLFPPGR
ncbi:MAG: protoglobin domain-containing protein [Caldilineaceae bacterium]